MQKTRGTLRALVTQVSPLEAIVSIVTAERRARLISVIILCHLHKLVRHYIAIRPQPPRERFFIACYMLRIRMYLLASATEDRCFDHLKPQLRTVKCGNGK